MPDPRPVLALDVGGTKLAAGVVAGDGRVLASARVPTPTGAGDDAGVLADALDRLADRVLADAGLADAGLADAGLAGAGLSGAGLAGSGLAGSGADGLAGVGIGCGGPMAWPAGEVSPVNIPAWRGYPLRAHVAERFPGVPVRLHNDAVCLAVAEHWRGAARGVDDVLGMVVSTGVGGGLVVGGRLVDGATGNAGHVGHVVVEPEGPACGCGGRGCVEAVARGPAVVAWARARGWRAGQPSADGRDLAADAAAGDAVATAALARAGAAVGVAVASVVALLDLRLVTVGGGLAQSGPALWGPLEEAFARHCRLSYTAGSRVVPAALGPEAGLVGAAALVLAGDRYWSGG